MPKTTKMLCILDGFGLAKPSSNNAVSLASTPTLDHLFTTYPWIPLDADGVQVGQEDKIVGNSEVGHMNIGGLGLVPQLSFEISQSASRNFGMDATSLNQIFDPKVVLSKWKSIRPKANLHLMTLFSSGRVHSDLRHLQAAISVGLDSGYEYVYLHLFSDGRDSSRDSFIPVLKDFMASLDPHISDKIIIASVSGRYWGMDRDKNWDRVYKNITAQLHIDIASQITGQDLGSDNLLSNLEISQPNTIDSSDTSLDLQITNLQEYVDKSYSNEVYDEYLEPVKCIIRSQDQGIQAGDGVYFLNFRTDRIKEITELYLLMNRQYDLDLLMLTNNDYGITSFASNEFDTNSQLETSSYYPVFKFKSVDFTLSKAISKNHKTQLHIAETEKYNHVTYFINGGNSGQSVGEDWQVFDSYKVSSHAQKPQMRAVEIADFIVQNGIGKYDYIIVNFANPDMVGHTGDLEAAKIAVETVDQQLHKFLPYIQNGELDMIITADHGNIELVGRMENGQINTEHDPNPVPCLLASKDLSWNDISKELDLQNQDYSYKVETNTLLNQLQESLDHNLDAKSQWLDRPLEKEQLFPLWYVGRLLLAI
jgi:2,3-bisphosphoglycerate-independent phosphoglycerate mutase